MYVCFHQSIYMSILNDTLFYILPLLQEIWPIFEMAIQHVPYVNNKAISINLHEHIDLILCQVDSSSTMSDKSTEQAIFPEKEMKISLLRIDRILPRSIVPCVFL